MRKPTMWCVGLPTTMKLALPRLSNFRRPIPNKAEAGYPVRLKFHRQFTDKGEFPPTASNSYNPRVHAPLVRLTSGHLFVDEFDTSAVPRIFVTRILS